ncbi:hypothetical protein L218DRAFT_1080357 [Marasmius fiardii PR-910]|nr:hypothetical protein L218DRAFT_1080357 [Marasmius fiardii PR-910]
MVIKRMDPLKEQVIEVSSQRCEYLPQLFGVGRSSLPTFIYHDALLIGDTVFDQFICMPVVWSYIWYRCIHSEHIMARDHNAAYLSKQIQVTRISDWVFNIKNITWHYNITSPLCPAGTGTFTSSFAKSHLDVILSLESKAIIGGLQQGFLELVASLRTSSFIPYFEYPAVHQGLITFGSIIDSDHPEILAHFPSTPDPSWYTDLSSCHGVKVDNSQSASGLLRRDFGKELDSIELDLYFGLRLDSHDHLQIAYLLQSSALLMHTHWWHLLFVDRLYFRLSGTLTTDFLRNYASRVHLFIHTISTEQVNGMPCLQWQQVLEPPPWHWSSDPEGKEVISKEDWWRSGIPDLELLTQAGSGWYQEQYEAVVEYLHMQGSDPYRGDQYARKNGYETMAKWDPHTEQARLQQADEDWVDLEGKAFNHTGDEGDSNPLTSPSVFSLISQSEARNDATVIDESMVSNKGVKYMSWLSKGWLKRPT